MAKEKSEHREPTRHRERERDREHRGDMDGRTDRRMGDGQGMDDCAVRRTTMRRGKGWR